MNSLPVFSAYSMDWLNDASCQDSDVSDFFVQAGHVIGENVLNLCRGCPVRLDCLKHAYNDQLNITGGYFAGMSPGQRREMSIEEAIEFINNDPVREIIVESPQGDDYVDDEDQIIYT